MSHRGRSPKLSSKAPPFSPRFDGAGVPSSRGVPPPSPLSMKGLDARLGSGSLPSVDYDDVFGGPPRLAATMLAAQSGHAPSAALDRATARTPSFRSPSFPPVFELPVFGDDLAGSSGSTTFEPRSPSVAYEDIFREEVQAPDVFPGPSVYGNIPRSKANSRPSSRGMSPVHAATASTTSQVRSEHNSLGAETAAAFIKGRPSAGKLSSRCSFSSFSSFDEKGRPPNSPLLMALKNDMVAAASLPCSPPHGGGTWGQVKNVWASHSANNLGVAGNGHEVDDVFGGFPQRTFSQAFARVRPDATDPPSSKSRTHSGGVIPMSKSGAGNKVIASELYEGLNLSLSSSSSSNDEEILNDDFIEIRMDRQNDASMNEKMDAAAGKVCVTLSDSKVSYQPIPKRTVAKPPPAPTTPLKHKSWKDWTSDVPGGQSVCPPSPGLIPLSMTVAPPRVKDLNNTNMNSHVVKGLVETFPSKQLGSVNSSAAQLFEKYESLPLGSEVNKAKLAEESLDFEQRELQALFANAWKNNEKRERKKATNKVQQQVPASPELNLQGIFAKEGKKHSSKQTKAAQRPQRKENSEGRDADELHWEAWRKYSSKGRKETAKANGFASDKKVSVQELAQEREGNLVKEHALSAAEDLFDPEEIVKVVTEEMSTNCNVASTVRSHGWAPPCITVNSGQGTTMENALTKEQSAKVCEGDNGVDHSVLSENGSIQEFVQFSEQIEVSLSGEEEIDCLIDGFQEIEGETLERRKARRERHLRAKERVAKALEEMQQRDAEVQRQQEEKQQLAVTSDQKVKRWAAGKEGNLRALLSNLQHVLWPECGWQPISLTDLIEGPDVKKAYRKATLFVHPDKVQQKGATVQQKYVAERVFDILQEAWKTFNMQELF